MKIKQYLARRASQLPGWHTKRKFIVIQSDDWGSIRMPSRAVYEKLKENGIKVDDSSFSKFDSLESNEDLSVLFDVLSRHRDKNGNNPILTANFNVANPDFEKIKESKFEQYFYEPLSITLEKYPNHNLVLDLYYEGMNKNLLSPQFHGREHLNVSQYLKALQRGNKEIQLAFDFNSFGVNVQSNLSKRMNFMAAFDYETDKEVLAQASIISEGAKMFERIFNYSADSFIAPCYVWGKVIEPKLWSLGFKTIQSIGFQYHPKPGRTWYRKIFRYTGQSNGDGLRYIVRNAHFEPSINSSMDWVDSCLDSIELAFKLRKPAVISCHRLNFIGSIFENNRTKNLSFFNDLLSRITKKWPEVEFVSTTDLTKYLD